MSYTHAYEDVAELIEDKGFEECSEGRGREVIKNLADLSVFFETMENKNNENTRDLSDIYLLIGEFCQCSEMYKESLVWFEKAIIVDDVYDASYHSLAISYLNLNDIDNAIKSLEQEIFVAPGNYYSYLFLADIFEKQNMYDDVERVLRNLLSRDSDNIQGLHTLIRHYIKRNPQLDVGLLRRRLIYADKQIVKLDLVIWTYYMLEEDKHDEALHYLDEREQESTGISIVHLLKAHIYGEKRLYVKKRQELIKFKRLNHGRKEFMKMKFDEFSKIFGEQACSRLKKKLAMTKLTSR